MQLWRKALALVLLMVFLPATVLAAMPVKLCVGTDGHRAIESSIGGDHHETFGHIAAEADAATASLDLPDCTDFDVLTVASSGIRHSSELSKSPSYDKMPFAVLLLDGGPRLTPPVLRYACGLMSAESAGTDPLLIALGTDVLLN